MPAENAPPSRLGRRILGAVMGFHTLLWVGGIYTYLFMPTPSRSADWAAPVFLLSAGLVPFLGWPRSTWPWLAWVGFVGWGSEVIGVMTGVPYGGYRYTGALGPQWLSVPVVMGFAWIALAAYVGNAVSHLPWSPMLKVSVGSLWMVAIDLVIDPLAAGPLGYWQWGASGPYYGIPYSNFVGWALVSLAALAPSPGRIPRSNAVRVMGLGLVAFFGLIAVRHRLAGPVIVSALLITLDALASWAAHDRVA